MNEKKFKNQHNIIGVLLILIGIFVTIALVLVYSQADDVTTTIDVANADPSVDAVYVASGSGILSNSFAESGVDLTAGSTKSIYITGIVSDTNGYEDISTVQAVFYRSGVGSTFNCLADNNGCYTGLSCSLTGGSGNTRNFYCEVPLQFYTDATDIGGRFTLQHWLARVLVTDTQAATANGTSNGVEINTLLSLNIPDSINYGSLAPGTSTTMGNNVHFTITQQGNDGADVEVAGSNMTCDVTGTIPVGNQKWSISDEGYELSNTLYNGDFTDTNIGVNYRDNDSVAQSSILYWNISLPEGVKGTCTGTNTITAIAS